MIKNSNYLRRLTAVTAVVFTIVFVLLQTEIIPIDALFKTTSISEQTMGVSEDDTRTHLETRATSDIDVSRLSTIPSPDFYHSPIVYLSDNDFIYYYSKRLEKITGATRKIINIDIESFAIIDTSYIKDKNGVYFLEWNEDVCTFKIVRNANVATFTHLISDIYRDSHHIYIAGVQVPDIDPDSFLLLGWRYYSDANGIYFLDKGVFTKILDADINSFEVLEMSYAKDTNHVYKNGKILPNIDSKTFVSPKIPPCTEC